MKIQHAWGLMGFLLLWAMVGCGVETTTEVEPGNPANGGDLATAEAIPAEDTAVPAAPTAEDRSIRLTPAVTQVIEVVPTVVPTTADTAVMGEVPQTIMEAVIENLATSGGLKREAINIMEAEAVVWNDGALGCPQPGQVYTQAIVSGYRIVLEADGRTFHYHAAENGYFILCENSLPILPPDTGTPTS